MNNKYLEIPKNQLCSSFDRVNQTMDIFNLKKNELKKICLGLQLAHDANPKDRVISKMLREYTSYLANYE